MWYHKIANSEITITGPYEGVEHITSPEEYLQYKIFTAVDSKTNKNIGYILFQMPKNAKFIKEFLYKNPSFDHKYLWNSYTLQVSVAPEYRKQGIATRLYKKVDEYLEQHNKPELKFFEYSHLSPGAQHIWNKRMQRNASAPKDFSYFSIGHSRDFDNIILWMHDGEQLHHKVSTPQQKTHLSAFRGIHDIARGRIELDKKISSFAIDLPDDLGVMQQKFLRKKIIRDFTQTFPDVQLSEHGQIIEANSKSYFRLKFAQFGAGYGEWWIDESGATMYADIDIGDKGHEMYVVEHVQGEIVNYLKLQTWNEDFWNSALVSVAEDLLDEAHGNDTRKKHIEDYIGEKLENIKPNELIESDYVEDYMVGELRVNKQMMDIAMGRGDIRLYGVKNLGWKRVMNKFVDTWQLTSQDCVAIARGLSDIAQEDEEGTSLWTIEVRSTNKYYPNIPLSVIESGPMAISKYARGQN